MIALIALIVACGPKKTEPLLVGEVLSPDTVSLFNPVPVPQPGATFTPPEPSVHTLSSGATVWLIERPGLPLVSVRLLVAGGRAADPADQPGLVGFSDDMLTHGAGDRDAQAFAQAMDQLAIDLDAYTTDTHTVVSLDTHAERLAPALDLMADAVLAPRFDADEVDRVREIRKGDLTVAMDSPRSVSGWVTDRVYYGEGHPLAHPGLGTEASLTAFTAQQLRDNWAGRRTAAAPHLVVVGDVTAADVLPMLDERLSSWAVTGTPPGPVPAPAGVSDGPALYLVDNPGAAQTMIQVTMPGPAIGDADVQAARLGTVVLGGTFTSRLNRLLREEKGYTYGARARLYPTITHGLVVASSAVQRDVTAPALVDMLAELDRLQLGLTDDEIKKALGSTQTDLVDASSGRSSLADTYAAVARSGRGPDALTQQVAATAQVTAAGALAALANSHSKRGAVVVVGDLAEIQTAVTEAVPGGWQVLDKWGAPVK